MGKVLAEFIKRYGRKPKDALEWLQFRFKFAQESGKGEVVQFPPEAITDWTKARPQPPQTKIIDGIQTTRGMGDLFERQLKKTVKQRGPQRGVGAGEQVSAAGATRIKQGFSTQSKLNSWSQNQQWVKDFIGRKNAEFNSLNRADQKSVLDMFEAQIKKHKPKEPLAGGGIAGMLGERMGYDNGKIVKRKNEEMSPLFETNDPKEAFKEVIQRLINIDPAKIPLTDKLQLMFDLNRIKAGGSTDLFGGELNFGYNKDFGREGEGFGFEWKKQFAGGGVAGMLGEPTYEEDNHRVPFKLGGIDKVRRAFLQAMGAGAAGVGAAKTGLFGLLKGGGKKQIVENLTQVPIENAAGMPSWFKPLVNRVIKEGTETTNLAPNKGGALAEREIVHSAKLGENQGVRVYQNLDNQTITVEYQSVDNMGGVNDGIVRLEYKAAEEVEPILAQHMDPKNPKGPWLPNKAQKTKPTFEANEAWPYADNPFGHRHQKRNITFEGENTVTKVDDLYSDTSALKQFGTGKDLSKKELTIAKQKRDKVKKINTDSSEAELLSEMPKDFDFATGGRVPFVGGGWAFKLAKKYSQSKEYKKFIEKLFLKTSNDIRKGEGMFKDLTTSQKITQHDNLTNEITKFQKTGELPESAHQYFGFNPEQKYADKLLKKQLKMTPEEELRQEFPGITDEMVNNILTDTNTQRIAEVKATMKEALKMQEKGMGTEEIINVFKNIKPTKHASGGRVGMLFGGGVWKKIIQNLAKEKGISPSAYLAVTNWKHLPEGIRKIISKSQFEKIKEGRVEMFENLVDMAKTRKAFLDELEQGKKTPTAGIFEHLEKSFKSPVPHGVTDKDILQGEVILKNLKTGGKKGPELNASGGLAGMLGE
jgi:hypothetical protein